MRLLRFFRSAARIPSGQPAGRLRRLCESAAGYSIFELLATMTLGTILTGIAVFNFVALRDSADNGAAELTGFFKKARAKALATTMAYTVQPQTATRVIATIGTSCSAAQAADPEMILDLPTGATLSTLGWAVCYNTRGYADDSLNIVVSDTKGTQTVQVVLGGAVRAL